MNRLENPKTITPEITRITTVKQMQAWALKIGISSIKAIPKKVTKTTINCMNVIRVKYFTVSMTKGRIAGKANSPPSRISAPEIRPIKINLRPKKKDSNR